MKKRNIFTALLVCLLLVGCGGSSSDSNTTDTQNKEKQLEEGNVFYYKDKEYQLPITVSEFESITGWQLPKKGEIPTSHEEYEVNPNEWAPQFKIFMDEEGDHYHYTAIFNPNDEKTMAKDCVLTSISANSYEEEYKDFSLPGGIKIGSTKEEVIEAYGEPIEEKEDYYKNQVTLYYQTEHTVGEGDDVEFYYTGKYVIIDLETNQVITFCTGKHR